MIPRWRDLIAVDPVELRAFDGDLHAEIARAVAAANARLDKVEQVKRYRVLREPWVPGGDEVTTTLKLRRGNIAAKYAAEIEALYT